jgi:hypothetical protein
MVAPFAATSNAGTNVWEPDGVRVAESVNYQGNPEITSDGTGGSIIAWMDRDAGGIYSIYVQRLLEDGEIATGWPANGVCVSNGTNDAGPQVLVGDGSGGAIIAWSDDRLAGSTSIYAQRLLANGSVAAGWPAEGLAVFALPGHSAGGFPEIISDGSGGAIVTWADNRDNVDGQEVYAQRLKADGTTAWAATGVKLSTGGGVNQRMASDGADGAVVTWQHDLEVLAQRILPDGHLEWTAGGVRLSNNANPSHMDITQAGKGAWIVDWFDGTTSDFQIKAQKVVADGSVAWAPEGVVASGYAWTTYDFGQRPEIVSDGAGGAIIAWYDQRLRQDGTRLNDVYAQRVLTDGRVAWNADGIRVRTVCVGGADMPDLLSDGAGGAVVVWADWRNEASKGIYAQRLLPNGGLAWTSDAIRTGDKNGASAPRMASDGKGGTVIVWGDSRVESDKLYAQRVVDEQSPDAYMAEGSTAHSFTAYMSIQNPRPQDLNARLTYMKPDGTTSEQIVGLPAASQTTVHPADAVGQADFSTRVECLQGKTIIADRTTTWTGPGATSEEAFSSIGTPKPSKTWYFPEGCSAHGFETWTLIGNPNSKAAHITLHYMIEGWGPRTAEKLVPARGRGTYFMADDIGSKNASVMVTSDIPVTAEHTMFRNNRREGSNSVGASAPAKTWYLAEGSTAWGFSTYVLLQNPASTKAKVTLTCMTPSGPRTLAPFVMEPGSRRTVKMNDSIPNEDFSTRVSADTPVVAERAMYWDSPAGEACHDSIGLSSLYNTFYLPDGQTTEGRETWTLVQNPNSHDISVKLTYQTPDGRGNVSKVETIPANSRRSFNMYSHSGMLGRAAIMVESPYGKITVERAMYWNSRATGTDTIGGYSD